MDIKNLTNRRGGTREQAPWVGGFFFYIFLYYLINVIIKTLYISSFCCCLHYIFYTQFILMCFDVFFSSPEKLTFCCKKCIFNHRFDLDGLNTHYFVGNLIANSAALSKKLFSICFQKKRTQNPKQLHKTTKFRKKI